MSYKIEWLNDAWTHALVTEKRWFKPPRVAEVEMRESETGTFWIWYHANSDVRVAGVSSLPCLDGSVLHGTELQRELSLTRNQMLHKRDLAAMRNAAEELRAEQDRRWRSAGELPKATVRK